MRLSPLQLALLRNNQTEPSHHQQSPSGARSTLAPNARDHHTARGSQHSNIPNSNDTATDQRCFRPDSDSDLLLLMLIQMKERGHNPKS